MAGAWFEWERRQESLWRAALARARQRRRVRSLDETAADPSARADGNDARAVAVSSSEAREGTAR